ncbi:MAG: pyridoxal-phosphate dependent enzyme, partial [Candidatus Bathyarchaeia archaeon]
TMIQVKGSFDNAMRLVQQASEELGIYLLNSINPWRIEGQKTIVFDLIQQLDWKPPDWIVLPAGNLGNTSAFGKALTELEELDLIDEKPRLAAIQAEGADPFYRLWSTGSSLLEPNSEATTVASAIRIGNPVSWKKALSAIKNTNGVVEHVSDQEIMDSKVVIDRSGIGCEPASAASVAGAKRLFDSGVIDKGEKIVCVLTGNILKDPDSTIRYFEGGLPGIKSNFVNSSKVVEPSMKEIRKTLEL